MDLKSPKLRKMLKKDKYAIALKSRALESLWRTPPKHVPRPNIKRHVSSRLEEEDPMRSTSLQACIAANEQRAAVLIQHKYLSYRRRERFRAWVRLAMNTDAGRNKLATVIGSKFWRRCKCLKDYHRMRTAIIEMQNFYRVVHARKRAMKRALKKLRHSLNAVLGQEWRLHQIVSAVENNGRKKDRERIHLATNYLVSQGHGIGMSVPGVLRLCNELKKTKKSVRSKKKRQEKIWRKKRPKSWEAALQQDVTARHHCTTMLLPTSPVSLWFGRQRRTRERRQREEEEHQLDRLKELERRRLQKIRYREEDEKELMRVEDQFARQLVEDDADRSFPWPKGHNSRPSTAKIS
jgi:hypothetical protein